MQSDNVTCQFNASRVLFDLIVFPLPRSSFSFALDFYFASTHNSKILCGAIKIGFPFRFFFGHLFRSGMRRVYLLEGAPLYLLKGGSVASILELGTQ